MGWVLAEGGSGKVVRDPGGATVPTEVHSPDTSVLLRSGPKAIRRNRPSTFDGTLLHVAGRNGKDRERPTPVAEMAPSARLRQIVVDRALLATRQFGNPYGWPAVCFMAGDDDSRSRLWSERGQDRWYEPWGIAFDARSVEGWGARPVIYADTEAVQLLQRLLEKHVEDALDREWRLTKGGNNDAALDTAVRRRREAQLALHLLMRDDPGPALREDPHTGATLGMGSPRHEWRHEQEWRLYFPARRPSSDVPGLLSHVCWTFRYDSVVYLLLPYDGACDWAADVAAEDDEIATLPVRLVSNDGGTPRDIGTLADLL